MCAWWHLTLHGISPEYYTIGSRFFFGLSERLCLGQREKPAISRLQPHGEFLQRKEQDQEGPDGML